MIIRNPYKREDVFRCTHASHARFNGQVSAHHILQNKKCYPDGCLYFLWHCALMEKGKRCIHKYKYVGKNCGGCTYYLEEKVHLQPDRLLSDSEYDEYLDELESFDMWLSALNFKRCQIAGKISTVKPWFEELRQSGERHTRLRGYLLVIKNGFIGLDQLEDTFYIRVPERQMKEFNFVSKMKIELAGEVRIDRGRIVIHRPGSIEIVKNGWGKSWTRDRALVAVRTATYLRDQPRPCLTCPWGALADVKDSSGVEEKRYRRLYCLKGVQDVEGCYVLAALNERRRKKRQRRKKQAKKSKNHNRVKVPG